EAPWQATSPGAGVVVAVAEPMGKVASSSGCAFACAADSAFLQARSESPERAKAKPTPQAACPAERFLPSRDACQGQAAQPADEHEQRTEDEAQASAHPELDRAGDHGDADRDEDERCYAAAPHA